MKEYDNCFACGEKNETGLKLKFYYEEKSAICKFDINKSYEGYPGIVHGGIVSTILDEAMAKIIIKEIGEAVTVEMKTKFRKKLESEKLYQVTGIIMEIKSRTVSTYAEIKDMDGFVIASAEATFFKIRK